MTYNPIRDSAEAFNAAGAEKCASDPKFMATGMCPVCVMDHPCICDMDRTITKMREYYEANRRIDPISGSWFRAGRPGREEPVGYRNWGVKDDVLMGTLYRIAKDEILSSMTKGRKQKAAYQESVKEEPKYASRAELRRALASRKEKQQRAEFGHIPDSAPPPLPIQKRRADPVQVGSTSAVDMGPGLMTGLVVGALLAGGGSDEAKASTVDTPPTPGGGDFGGAGASSDYGSSDSGGGGGGSD